MWLHLKKKFQSSIIKWSLLYIFSVLTQWCFTIQNLPDHYQTWTNILGVVFCSLHLFTSLGWIAYLMMGEPSYHQPKESHPTRSTPASLNPSSSISLASITPDTESDSSSEDEEDEPTNKDTQPFLLSTPEVDLRLRHLMNYYDYTMKLMWIDMMWDTLQWLFIPDVSAWAGLPFFITATFRWYIVYICHSLHAISYFRLMFEYRFSASFIEEQSKRLLGRAFTVVGFTTLWTLVIMFTTIFYPIQSSSTPSYSDLKADGWVEEQRTLWLGSWWGMLSMTWMMALEDYSCLQAHPKLCIPTLQASNIQRLASSHPHIPATYWSDEVTDFFTWIQTESNSLLKPLVVPVAYSLPEFWRGWPSTLTYTVCIALGFSTSLGSWLWTWLSSYPSSTSYTSWYTIIDIISVSGCGLTLLGFIYLGCQSWTQRYTHLINMSWLVLAWSWIPLLVVIDTSVTTWGVWQWMAWSLGTLFIPFLWLILLNHTIPTCASNSNEWILYQRPWLFHHMITKFYDRFIERPIQST